MLPGFDDAALLNLRSNTVRLAGETGARNEEAAMLLPLIEAEVASREVAKPPKLAPRARRTVAKA